VLRQPLLVLARSDRVKNLASSMPISSGIVRRYVAGETTDTAVDASRQLIESGL
jgi:proline dehydrogenase